MVCKNCGGKIEKTDEVCPFCGAMNAEGAEQGFMKKLYGMEAELRDGADMPVKTLKKTSSRSFRMFVGAMLLVAVLITAINVLGWKAEEWQDRRYEKEAWERILWRDQHYEVMDQLYAKNDLDGALAYAKQAQEGVLFGIYDWEHSAVLEAYEIVLNCREAEQELSEQAPGGTLSYQTESAALDAFELAVYRSEDWLERSAGEEDQKRIEQYQAEALGFLTETLKLTDQKLAEWNEASQAAGYLDYSLIRSYLGGE